MELSQEEKEKIWADKMEKDKRMKEQNNRHQEIVKLFKSSKLTKISPIWHINHKEIDLTKQRHNLCEELLEDGFTIIDNINIELLFDEMNSGNPDMFRKKVLYNKDLDESRISDVLDNWIKGTKLIPPTILVINDTNKLFATDGKHRLNVAYYYGATTIPIFVVNKQLEKIKTILNIN